jgi:hypothetical protein
VCLLKTRLRGFPARFSGVVLLLLSISTVNAVPAQRPKQSRADRKGAERKMQEQTLVGTVEWEYKPLSWDCDAPNCDHFALYDAASGVNYDLDNSLLASRYEGKKVRLTGSVDTKNDSIHVISMEEIK